jgi:hypothetical protein
MAHELMPLGQSACAGVVRSKARRIRRVMVSPWWWCRLALTAPRMLRASRLTLAPFQNPSCITHHTAPHMPRFRLGCLNLDYCGLGHLRNIVCPLFLLPKQAFFNLREKCAEPLFCTLHFCFVKLNLGL